MKYKSRNTKSRWRMKFSFLQRHKDIFQGISGSEDIKWMLEQTLTNPEPLHILLVGPPGVGKTRFLKAIEKEYADKSYFGLASAATGTGMINACFENTPRYLLIDEIEDLNQNAQASLLSLLQDGCLVETKVRRIDFKCSMFATCNNTKKLRAPLLSRFVVIEMQLYTEKEFKSITYDILKDNPLADYISAQIWNTKQPNIRDCVRIATLAKTEQDVLRILRVVKL